mmetsp:Transcript_17491/g.24592  ORF Transcript_17491/g.24592 Transcript_17491/m.24592 type:complete len:204 (+) Transcript_17491:1276-1887(+)
MATISSSTVIVSTTAVSSSSATTRTSTALRLSLIDTEFSSIEFLSVDLGTCHLSFSSWHGDKGKSTDLLSIAIRGEEAINDRPVRFKETFDCRFRCIKAKVTDIKFHFFTTSCIESTRSTRAESTSGGSSTLGTRFIDTNSPSVQLSLVHFGNCIFSGLTSSQGDKPESTWTGGTTFHGKEDFRDCTELAKGLTQASFVRGVI